MTNRKFGWKRSLPDHRDFKYALHGDMQKRITLPDAVDLRPLMSPIDDQATLNDCVAFATVRNLEFLELQELRAKTTGAEVFDPNTFTPISELFVYWNARGIDGDQNKDQGTENKSAIMAIRNSGICRKALWPNDVHQVLVKPSQACFDEAQSHQALFAYQLDNSKIVQMKQTLALGFPFIYGISVYDSFMTKEVEESGVIPMPGKKEAMQGGHSMCCVGYSDEQQAFIAANSWGTDWGIQGCCYIPYEYLTSLDLCSDVWTLRKESRTS